VSDNEYPPFLGPCEVCCRISRTYLQLAGHLRRKDPAHQALKARWHAWREVYRATLRCRKCGDLFEIRDKGRKDCKRCPRCETLSQTLSRRQYEALTFDKSPDPRRMNKDAGSRTRWAPGYNPEITWVPEGELYNQVVVAIAQGRGYVAISVECGIPERVVREIATHALGVNGCAEWLQNLKVGTMHANREKARKGSGLEQEFENQLQGIGVFPCSRNDWITLEVAGQKVRREADLKVEVGGGRKIVVLCDGVAFHGPGCLYGDPEEKIAEDRDTALAFYGVGYSVVRYSGDEIRNGEAIAHFQKTLSRLTAHKKVYRNWCPAEERTE